MTADASGLAGASDVASIGSDLGSDFSAGLDALGGFAKRGGLIGHYDTGGTPTYNSAQRRQSGRFWIGRRRTLRFRHWNAGLRYPR